MRFVTLGGREIRRELKPSRFPVKSRDHARSEGQYNLGKVIQTIYPQYVLLEDFTIPESRLSLDFFVPVMNLAFEFQGSQHDEYNAHFHATKEDFTRQQKRDGAKQLWCHMNSVTLVCIRDSAIGLPGLKAAIMEARRA